MTNVVGNSIKCGLFVALFAVLSTVFFTGSSASALGSGGINPPLCTGYPEFNDWVTSHENYNENTAWIAFQRDWSGTPYRGKSALFVQWNTPATYDENKKIQILGNNVDTFGLGLTNGKGYTIDIPPVGDLIFTEVVSYSGSTGSAPYDIKCLEQFKNVEYHPDYIAAGGSLFEDRNYGTPAQPTAHKPNISWSVDDKDVTIHSDSAKNTAVLDDYQIYWWVSNSTFDGQQPSEPFSLSGCTPPDYNNNFIVPVYFDYPVQAYYADSDCNIINTDNEGNLLVDNMEVLRIDGSTFSGSTTDHEPIIGEIPENAILKAINKFKPNDGGISTLIFAPIEAIATLPNIVGTCSPITLPLLGENVELTCIRPTIQASPMGIVYNTISIIITGLVTWWVAWRTFSTIKNIQDPQDDKVEVLKL